MMEHIDYSKYDKYYKLLKLTLCPIVRNKTAFEGETLPDIEGPAFILCNHNTDYDFIILAGQTRKPIDFVATETMQRMGAFSRLLSTKLKPILHDKGSKGTATIKQIVGRIKDGRNVALFPEGNRSFDGRTGEISDAMAKIVKMTGATLVIYKLTGGYFTTPRWGKDIRKGKMRGKVEAVLSPAEVKAMPVDELQSLILNSLYTDAYKEQEEKPVKFISSSRAEYLETLLFMCPKCNAVGSLRSQGNDISCNCGLKYRMDEYGFLWDNENEKQTITELYEKQKSCLDELTEKASDDQLLWSDDVTLSKLTFGHELISKGKTVLAVYKSHLLIGEDRIEVNCISSVDIVQRNRLIIHLVGSTDRYEIMGDDRFNAVKYRLWYERSSFGRE